MAELGFHETEELATLSKKMVPLIKKKQLPVDAPLWRAYAASKETIITAAPDDGDTRETLRIAAILHTAGLFWQARQKAACAHELWTVEEIAFDMQMERLSARISRELMRLFPQDDAYLR